MTVSACTMWPSLLAVAAFAGLSLATFDINLSPNAVAICYSVWHSLGYTGLQPPDITEIEQGQGAFAPQGAWHFWGRPDGGYYGGGDRDVLDRHFAQISGAGIDFIVIDATNLQVCCIGYYRWTKALCLIHDFVGLWRVCYGSIYRAFGRASRRDDTSKSCCKDHVSAFAMFSYDQFSAQLHPVICV